jgi:hypothetical protein
MSARRLVTFLLPRGRRAKGIRPALLVTATLLLLISVPLAVAELPSAGLDRGFLRLYDLDFSGTQKEFESWEKLNPDNPMGPASEAAGILFSEFNRLGVLESQFYVDDSVFGARKKYEADPQQRARFDHQLTRAEAMAKPRLSRDSKDRDALLAMTLAAGLRSDFAALIEKRNLASLQGHLLAPFARILLAVAYVLEKDLPRAHDLLVTLQRDFPNNTLFGRELASAR